MIEIKPYAQTIPPKFPGRQTQRYVNELSEYIRNQNKWSAARAYAEQRNAQFVVLHEGHLGIGKKPKNG